MLPKRNTKTANSKFILQIFGSFILNFNSLKNDTSLSSRHLSLIYINTLCLFVSTENSMQLSLLLLCYVPQLNIYWMLLWSNSLPLLINKKPLRLSQLSSQSNILEKYENFPTVLDMCVLHTKRSMPFSQSNLWQINQNWYLSGINISLILVKLFTQMKHTSTNI